MPATIYPKITDAGKAAAVNASANGLAVSITHVALGTDRFDSAATGAAMTTMPGRKEAVTIAGGVVTGAGGFRVSVLFKSWTGSPATYNATSIAFYMGDPTAGGKLFAIYSHPSDVIVLRNALDYVASFNLQLTDVPSGSINVVIDPSASLALALISQHEGASDPHPGYVKKKGDDTTGPIMAPTPAISAATKVLVNAEWVMRRGIGFPHLNGGIAANTSAFDLSPAQVGSWVEAQVNNQYIGLPKASECPVGATFQFLVSATVCTLVPRPGDILQVAGYGSLPMQLFCQGETITVTRNAVNDWYVVGHGYRMPVGTVNFFAGVTAPPGWLKLNGALLGRAAYPALWTFAQSQGVVGEQDWGAGGYSGRFSNGTNGSDFRIPDARGLFLRGLDDGRGLDVGRGWGTYQDHANRSHVHPLIENPHSHGVLDNMHGHSGRAIERGNHTHGVPPGVDGAFAYTGNAGVGNNDTAQGLPTTGDGFGRKWSAVPTTGEAGLHDHPLSIDAAYSNIGIYGATTGITMQAEGSEARPRNLSWVLAVKF